MSSPFLGEVRMFGGNFAPVGWAFCNGQVLAISQNDALFALIGTTYGGDGVTTFALPNLISRTPISFATNDTHVQGQSAGEETVTLTQAQLPAHSHPVNASDNAATATSPAGNVWASWSEGQYSTAAPNTSMDASGLSVAGQSLPHDNRPPYLGLSFIIALEGIFPSRN
jgi:microcystin-dependent protein